MKNFIQQGVNLTLFAPYAVSSGDGCLIGDLFGVAAGHAAQDDEVDLVTQGVFRLPKTAALAVVTGDPLYWHDGTPPAPGFVDKDCGRRRAHRRGPRNGSHRGYHHQRPNRAPARPTRGGRRYAWQRASCRRSQAGQTSMERRRHYSADSTRDRPRREGGGTATCRVGC